MNRRDGVPEIGAPPAGWSTDVLAAAIANDGGGWEARKMVEGYVAANEDVVLRRVFNLSKEEAREASLTSLKTLVRAMGDDYDPATLVLDYPKAVGLAEALVTVPNGGVQGRFGVQFGLFFTTLFTLLPPDAKQGSMVEAMARARKAEEMGCFAMTELAHGSNVAALGTTARWSSAKGAFILSTPNTQAQKYWVGQAAKTADAGVVWANLVDATGVSRGPHCFYVPMRTVGEDGQRTTLPGVFARDCGSKIGLHAQDNGRIWFDNVVVPREHLLSRWASVDAHGAYSSKFPSERATFGAQLGPLVVNRAAMASLSARTSAWGLAIAGRYALQRRAFGPPNASKSEVVIAMYTTHQRRLLPAIAMTYLRMVAFAKFKREQKEATARPRAQYARRGGISSGLPAPVLPASPKKVHVWASAMKVTSSWAALEILQDAREACGGMGYSAHNLIGPLRADADHIVTVEGDNTVLLQQAARAIMGEFQGRFVKKVPGSKKKGRVSMLSVAKYTVATTSYRVFTLNPLAIRETSSSHLRSLSWMYAAAAFRVETLTSRLASEAQGAGGGWEGWNAGLPTAKELVDAYAMKELLSSTIGVLPQGGDAVAERVFALAGLSWIERNSGFFLESGFVAPSKAAAVRKQVGLLCTELLPMMSGLIDAWDFPEWAWPRIAQSSTSYVDAYKFFDAEHPHPRL